MKRRLLPLCTALVLCLLLAPAAWAAVYPYPPIETLHIGSHDGTEIQKDTYYLVRGETVTTQGASAENYNIYYKDGTLTLCAAALLLQYGQEPEESCREIAPILAKNLTKSQIMRTIELLQKYRGECTYNVGTGHVLGAIAVELEGIL